MEVLLTLRFRRDVEPAILGALAQWRVGNGPKLPRPPELSRRERAEAETALTETGAGAIWKLGGQWQLHQLRGFGGTTDW
jgi:hypothetical protein